MELKYLLSNQLNMKIERYITENGTKKAINVMEEEYKYGPTVVNMKVIGKMIKQI